MLKQREAILRQAETLKTIPIDFEPTTVEKLRVCIMSELSFAENICPEDPHSWIGGFRDNKFNLSPETLEAARFLIHLLFDET